METVRERISKNIAIVHSIFDCPENPKSYSSRILLREYYSKLDVDYDFEHDWRYLFIAKRTYLRHQRKNGIWTCHYCGRELYKMPERNKVHQNVKACVTVDHVIPACRCADKTDSQNFVPSCMKCNTKKSSRDYQDFVRTKQLV
ncbi:MAG: hypothetical protein EHM34_09390 [Nitrosopumilales archaeon]|nr:MAG: hypothetical protein EHM34_09390 [Nitrosopumilales archaeon]